MVKAADLLKSEQNGKSHQPPGEMLRPFDFTRPAPGAQDFAVAAVLRVRAVARARAA